MKGEFFISGLYALIKILTTTSSPLFLMAFIKIVEGNAAFKYEGYALTLALFIVKTLESLSERQWYFKTRLIGLQVRSLVSAAIYQKQLRLSNSVKMAHSPGEMVNYVIVDAYRIDVDHKPSTMPFTTYCLVLSGLAIVSALIVVILSVLASSPLAKLQHEYQTKFMVAQNPENFAEASKDKAWQKAMEAEMDMIEKNETWKLVDRPSDKPVIGVKWVYKTKLNLDGSIQKHKARLVVKGYAQKPGIDFNETFAPEAEGQFRSTFKYEDLEANVIEGLRADELKLISQVLSQKGYHLAVFWSSPILVSAVTFWTCYSLGFELSASNVFTYLATLRNVQEPIRQISDVFGAFIEAKVSLSRIVYFLDAPELEHRQTRKASIGVEFEHSILIRSSEISWDTSAKKATLRNINLVVKPGEKVAICGEVGSGKSTLLAAILGEVPRINGIVQVHGKIAYVSQSAWIQTGTIQENILFGSVMDHVRYQETLEKCSLLKDLEMLPFHDLTQIGERGVNLSGGQKQRIQLARALYQNADVYLLDDPFSAVDAHTATSLFNEYIIGALSEKTVMLVTHQVDFLPSFNSILLMSAGKILKAAPYKELLTSCQEFQHLVNVHNDTAGCERQVEYASKRKHKSSIEEIEKVKTEVPQKESSGDQLIKKEEKETG
ncbi:multidrug resistance-associated protein 14 [Prunus dulcis]|uniref:ABC-type xenobiotic transporter n=1 Tax=Prunus dulcis TaxID=3755 RepID=A0A4Y1RHR2_PRUDU|nr:multidrug resistance-associated protein 14 [Prunus dulcis]